MFAKFMIAISLACPRGVMADDIDFILLVETIKYEVTSFLPFAKKQASDVIS
ncbi:hypothetical protein VCE7224_03919 [Vibrio celticus]|uniref:Uncharacterized protein n=1 Tax=Vibrio celticus TaxID=446372 RepID=A0A1C3JJ76_9VIBR|nr:hypothetical protein VCE7224_03919 [Vibrio celticus]